MTIDSHHHFWNYSEAEYGWIGPDMGLLRRDFGPADLNTQLEAAGVDAAISVQAQQTTAETDWLLETAADNSRIAGVVGWVALADETVSDQLGRLSENKNLVGVRHVVQDEPDDNFILGEAFNRGVSSLSSFDLVYDILIFQRHLQQTIEFVDRHPNQVFVLDHIAKPIIEGPPQEAWLSGIAELAKRENVSCKISGVVTEVRLPDWDEDLLKPYIDHVIQSFGPQRLMYGSDWPVCLLRSNYRRWIEAVRGYISHLSPSEQDDILGGTAARVYSLPNM